MELTRSSSEKLSFDKDYSEDIPGPYFDPFNNHIHIWKQDKLIPNFKCEQNPSKSYIQFTDYKKGTYCSICHTRNLRPQFNWRPEPDSEFINIDDYKVNYNCVYIEPLKKGEFKEFDTIIPEKKEVIEIPKSFRNWKKLMNKVFYSFNNDKIVYNISKYKSLLLWPWEMTPYQKFKYYNKDYKNSEIFIDTSKKFKDNYVFIS